MTPYNPCFQCIYMTICIINIFIAFYLCKSIQLIFLTFFPSDVKGTSSWNIYNYSIIFNVTEHFYKQFPWVFSDSQFSYLKVTYFRHNYLVLDIMVWDLIMWQRDWRTQENKTIEQKNPEFQKHFVNPDRITSSYAVIMP